MALFAQFDMMFALALTSTVHENSSIDMSSVAEVVYSKLYIEELEVVYLKLYIEVLVVVVRHDVQEYLVENVKNKKQKTKNKIFVFMTTLNNDKKMKNVSKNFASSHSILHP